MVNKKATAPGMDPEVYNEIYTYIQAMINLYGVIHREKVVEIINMQNDYQISLDDLRSEATETSVFKPLIEQQEPITLPVQSFDPIPSSTAE